MSGPVIAGTYTAPQAVIDGQGFAAFAGVVITDPGATLPLTATITMTNAGTATDDNGTLTGPGLTQTATGTYTITAASPADLQAALQALIFTPAILGTQSPGGIYVSTLNTGLSLTVSDGVAPAVTDTNTVIYTLPGAQPLSLDDAAIPGAPNEFSSESRTGETSYVTTPVAQTAAAAAATNITAVLNGQTVYQQSFDLPYADPIVQAAVAQADAVLASDGAAGGPPALASSLVTSDIPYTTTVLTGEQTPSPTFSVTTIFGPGPVFGVMDINGTPNSTFTLNSGQVDFNTNLDYQTTIDQTVTTTATTLTTQNYTITGTQTTTGPVISGIFAPQAVTDGQPFAAFGNVTITDAGSSGALTATITMTDAGTATDHNGTLTGTGLTQTGTGTYTLTAASPAALQAALRAVLFTPTELGGTSNLATGLSLSVADGIAAAVTDTNTLIYTLLGATPLSAEQADVPGEPNQFTSATRTGTTTYDSTPVSQTATASATVITAVLNGATIYDQSFDLPYSDPAVQAAITQANQLLAADNASASLPALTSSQITTETPQITTVLTGEQVGTPTLVVTTYFGPGPLFTSLDVNGTPDTTVALLAGQEDTNVNTSYQTTIDQTVTTTTTQLTTQNYTITGTSAATCFAAGTMILTMHGPVAVQNLRIGDMLPTLHGGAQPIKWLGRRDYDGRFIAGNHLMLPVCIRHNAISENQPNRDLTVSPGHGIYLAGAFIPAWRLVNGVSITQAAQVDRVSYFHIELAAHEVIFAENCAVESFLDGDCRHQFANAAQFHALYPDDGAGLVLSCAPRLEHGIQLDAITRRIAARAGVARPAQAVGALRGFVDQAGPALVTGWAQLEHHPEAPVHLDILINGRLTARVLANQYRADLRAAGLGSGCHAFSLALPDNVSGRVDVRSTLDHTPLQNTTAAEIAA